LVRARDKIAAIICVVARAHIVKKPTRRIPTAESKLTYHIKAAPLVKKLKKPEAAKVMYDFYHLNEKRLSSTIVTKRELIIGLLMEGMTAEDAFAKASRAPDEQS